MQSLKHSVYSDLTSGKLRLFFSLPFESFFMHSFLHAIFAASNFKLVLSFFELEFCSSLGLVIE
jgi:hypothetical protein